MTARTTGFLAALLVGHTFVLASILIGRYGVGIARPFPTIMLRALLWSLSLALQINNYQLVICGPQDIHFKCSPSLINRPDLFIRLCNHVLVNWSVIFVTLLGAQMIVDSFVSTILVWAPVTATILVWLNFNLLHRQFN